MQIPMSGYQQIRARSSNGDRGAPSPPAPKSHNFQVWLCASFYLLQNIVYHDRLPESENENDPPWCYWKPDGKNEKFPRYLKNPKKQKSSEKNEIHAVGYSTHQQVKKNNKKNLGRMREILGAYRKKNNNVKKCAMKFRNVDIWMVRYLTGNGAFPNQQSVLKSVHK